MIELKNITHIYNDNGHKEYIYKNFCLSIGDGELISLLGSSGCGKTTLVNIIASYLKPIGGEIIVDGKLVNFPGRDRIVINQENDLFEWMTVYENMKIATKDEGIIEKFLKLSGIYDFKEFYPSKLSGGMKKRLSLVRALATNAEFIVMDEPFGSLDNEIKERLHEEVAGIVKLSSKSVLLVTHDIEEAIFLSDRVIVIGGKPLIIKKEYKIDFHYPRRASLRECEEFIHLKNEIKGIYRLSSD